MDIAAEYKLAELFRMFWGPGLEGDRASMPYYADPLPLGGGITFQCRAGKVARLATLRSDLASLVGDARGSHGRWRRYAPGVVEPIDGAGRTGLIAATDVVDVFVYVVVLNLAAEYLPNVVSESFTLSLLTAVMLKLVLEIVVVVKNRAKGRLHAATTPAGKAGGAVLLWLVLVGSKFLVLKLESLVFGDAISLGGFFSVTLLIVVLLLSRSAVRRLLAPVGATDRGGRPAP